MDKCKRKYFAGCLQVRCVAGKDADQAFLRKLSLRNAGFMRHIYEAADAALQLRDFYRQISSPLLDDVTFVYPPDQVLWR